MKLLATVLSSVAVARAFHLPSWLVVGGVQRKDTISTALTEAQEKAPWQDVLPSEQDVVSMFEGAWESAASGVESAFEAIEQKLQDELEDAIGQADADADADETAGRPHHRHPHRGHRGRHGPSNKTIYELISESNYTTKFAKLVDEHEDIVELLNNTKANYTLFVPVDAAFKHIPDDKKPDKEFVEAVLRYHVGLGLYPAGRLFATHTLPTALDETWLGNKPQRLRTSARLTGVRVNFYSKVVAANIGAKNGIIHGVDGILVPPPMVGRVLSLFPTQFSTLLYAYEKTDFVKFIHGVKMAGSTVFAPTNDAFARLGPGANAFLFNTEKGLKYLTAILKYHIVVNETLYSDAYYGTDGESTSTASRSERYHIDMPTLLEDKSIGVDISRFGGFISMRVNGFSQVILQDALAKNGVVQVMGHVLIPRKPHEVGEEWAGGEIAVEELMERLEPYVEDLHEGWMGDL